MSLQSQFDREEEAIERDAREGRITLQEYNEQIRDLNASYREAARESAQAAYDDELGLWS